MRPCFHACQVIRRRASGYPLPWTLPSGYGLALVGVLIFVTEDFSASKQVKLDRPEKVPSDAVKVLKLNATRKFNTGIYPYSILSII